jgi:hypothetical protein
MEETSDAILPIVVPTGATLLACNETLCKRLGMEENDTLFGLIQKLSRGYDQPFREQIIPLFQLLDPPDLEPDKRDAMTAFRLGICHLYNCEIDITCFKHHPLTYGCRMPYYTNVVAEVMYMSKIVHRFEYMRTDTLLQDVQTMFQNCIDYSSVVNSSYPPFMTRKILDMYHTFLRIVLQEDYAPLTYQLHLDGKTERLRKFGEDVHMLSSLSKQFQRAYLDGYEKLQLEKLKTIHVIPIRTTIRKRKQLKQMVVTATKDADNEESVQPVVSNLETVAEKAAKEAKSQQQYTLYRQRRLRYLERVHYLHAKLLERSSTTTTTTTHTPK